jgi:hypothetical protein
MLVVLNIYVYTCLREVVLGVKQPALFTCIMWVKNKMPLFPSGGEMLWDAKFHWSLRKAKGPTVVTVSARIHCRGPLCSLICVRFIAPRYIIEPTRRGSYSWRGDQGGEQSSIVGSRQLRPVPQITEQLGPSAPDTHSRTIPIGRTPTRSLGNRRRTDAPGRSAGWRDAAARYQPLELQFKKKKTVRTFSCTPIVQLHYFNNVPKETITRRHQTTRRLIVVYPNSKSLLTTTSVH